VSNDFHDNSSEPRSGRVLVFIVAYQAEKHARRLFERIPAELYNRDDVHFLMIDDASRDASIQVADEWVREHGVENVSLLRNAVNQVYGGNQKLGFRIGIDAGFDFIILLHGDGQYAPELLPDFIRIWKETDADVVLGTRMHSVKSARAGGMPWYKVFANRFLTTFQNKVTGKNLSEYHTGYRAYSTRFLKKVPFEIDTNLFHFDTDILLQAFYVDAKIVEFPIPTHYGDEVCHVPGFKYAKDVIFSTLQYRAHRMGMLCALKYRNLRAHPHADMSRAMYPSQEMAVELVKKFSPQNVLQIGSGSGRVAQAIEQLGIRVTGVDQHEPAPGTASEYIQADLDKRPLAFDAFKYDVVLLLDVLEHLADPEDFLVHLRNDSATSQTAPKLPRLVITTPNIAFLSLRLTLLLGRFNYGERGILDITHRRLFTRASLLSMLRDCGYQIEQVLAVPVPFRPVIGGSVGKLLGQIAGVLAKILPSMFGFQTMVVCRPMPGVKQILTQSERYQIADLRVRESLGSKSEPVSEVAQVG
jgi:2-polyprenyl-3-methyl-5-hydroxy-6-metoxy-1,4-benzoquinol methylase